MSIFLELLVEPVLFLSRWLVPRLVRITRGHMVVNLEPAAAGRPINGTVTISARRRLGPAPLRVSLIGEEDRWEMKKGFEMEPYRVKRTEKIYRNEINVDPALHLERGDARTLLIHMPTPSPETGRIGSDDRAPAIRRTAAKADRKTAPDRPNRQRWTLGVSFDLRGPAFETELDLPLRYELAEFEVS